MTSPPPVPAGDARRLAAESLAAGDSTGWFERLYAESRAGTAEVPWDVPEPSAHLRALGLPPGGGRSALIVGCGPGRDAEHVAALGYRVTAFDISATAIDLARERHPGSTVDYVVADLLDPPAAWRAAYDLVVESNNVQALPPGIRAAAIATVGTFVAPGGTLIVLAAATTRLDSDGSGPPWPLTRAEIDAFATGDLSPVSVTRTPAPGTTLPTRWRAVFTRPSAGR
ncbi:methyltransferase type 12 [Actinoplanes italicus]|uniref:Methyltransferase family protein n=1 Tax=Actinoplanes italicus TaxID=113567 RepID=A0A2T0KGQ9_9ACTN|nr:class I SAM-dependent methyltransferase [Actinoplanes italicus]PRX22623.1 methyltransferase family protein [Actinoplanes italicus]GIE28143.1 methyltransferase type 12 [Actinoplanes italicus]